MKLSFMNDVHSGVTRYGEADHPSPLTVGTFNPTQLWGHVPTICQWGPGIWAASETSATAEALCSL